MGFMGCVFNIYKFFAGCRIPGIGQPFRPPPDRRTRANLGGEVSSFCAATNKLCLNRGLFPSESPFLLCRKEPIDLKFWTRTAP